MPKMLGETFPYPRTGTQPDNSERLIPVANIPGGVNDIYLPENPKMSGTDIYLPQVLRISGGANSIYLKDNTPV